MSIHNTDNLTIICDGCRTKTMKGARFECADCDDFDLCESCFKTRRKTLHRGHCFVAHRSRECPETVHMYPTFICDVCDDDIPIIGVRYQCSNCKDYDLCGKCYKNRKVHHAKDHVFKAMPYRENDVIASSCLGRSVQHRFSMNLFTDKHQYKPGETMYIRGIVLNEFTHCPGQRRFPLEKFRLQIKKASGDVLYGDEIHFPPLKGSVFSIQWPIPKDVSGGEHTLHVGKLHYTEKEMVLETVPVVDSTSKGRTSFFPIASRKFDIQVYRPKKFKMDLEFLKKGFGPGDKVRAFLHVERSEGGIPKVKIDAVARIDGREIFSKSYKCTSGKQVIDFKIPDRRFEEGDGTLSCAVSEGGMTENISKTLPMILSRLDCKLYPEGGDLVCGVTNGVYFHALLKSGEPADFGGCLVEKDDATGKINAVKVISTKHEGRGVFEFIPRKGKAYYINVLTPSGVTEPIHLPAPKRGGLGLRLPEKRSRPFGEKISIILCASDFVETVLVMYRKNVVVDRTEIFTIGAGEEKIVTLDPKDVDGCLRITAFFVKPSIGLTGLEYPVAERLVFVKPRAVLNFDVIPDRKQYFPGQRVKLRIRPKIAGEKKDKFVKSTVCVTVTDSAVHEMKEKRKRPPRLIETVYLENEVSELNDPTAYIFPDNIKNIETFVHPDICSDLLIGTQGWRRYMYKIQRTDTKFFEKPEFQKLGVEKEYFYRMLNLPNPEYHIRPVSALEEWRKEQEQARKKEEERRRRREEEERVRYSRYDGRRGGGGSWGGDLLSMRSRNMRGSAPRTQAYSSSRSIGFDDGFIGAAESLESESVNFSFGSRKKRSKAKSKPKPRGRKMRRRKMEETKKTSSGPVKKMKSVTAHSKKATGKGLFDMFGGMEMEKSKKSSNEKSSAPQLLDLFSAPDVSGGEMLNSRLDTSGDSMLNDFFGEIGLKGKKEAVKKVESLQEAQKRNDKLIEVVYCKQYANKRKQKDSIGERSDFVETVYYSSSEKTKTVKDGVEEVQVSFELCDSVTTFLVKIDAFTRNGVLGSSSSHLVECSKAFYVEPRLPLEISFLDKVLVPVAIVNNLEISCKCEVKWTEVPELLKFQSLEWKGKVGEKERKTAYFEMTVNSSFVKQEENVLTLEGHLPVIRLMDTVKKAVTVKPYGYPHYHCVGGRIAKKSKQIFEFELPYEKMVKGSVQTYAYVSLNPIGAFAESCKSMIRQPSGCFEQVASTMYPMIMAKQILTTQNVPLDRSFIAKADKYLDQGYKKLVAYEIKGGGFDWYGKPPANESLTALGLAQFIELQTIRTVDQKMVKRTKDWLLSRKTATGFKRNPGRYAYGHAPAPTANAYICYCLSRTQQVKYTEIEGIVETCLNTARSSTDIYIMSLMSLTMYNMGQNARALKLIKDHITKTQKSDGSFTQAASTITRSGGNNKTLEITALTTLAMLNFPTESTFATKTGKSIDFILKNNKNGRYGATQATCLCIQAIVKYFGSGGTESGKVELVVDGEVVSSLNVDKSSTSCSFEDFGARLEKGVGVKGKVELRNGSGLEFPFSINIGCKVTSPPHAAEDFPFRYGVQMAQTKVKQGQSTEVVVKLENVQKDKEIPMIVAVVALPGGVVPRIQKLKELKKQGKFEYYELFGAREVPKETIQFAFDVSGDVPGSYTADASRAYIYYDDDKKYYLKGLRCDVVV